MIMTLLFSKKNKAKDNYPPFIDIIGKDINFPQYNLSLQTQGPIKDNADHVEKNNIVKDQKADPPPAEQLGKGS